MIFLGDGYDSIGSLQWRSSGSDSLPLCFGHFPTSYMKNNCMENSLNFKKTVWCNKIWKTTFVKAIIHHHVLLWFFPIHINRMLTSRDSKHGSAVWQKVKFCIEIVNITFKQGTLGLIEMYLQFMDNVAWISCEKQGNALKYFCATVEILWNCSPPPVNIRM